MINDMFGFIVKQPIHKTLRQMRVVTITVIAVSLDIMYKLVSILENGGNLSDSQTTAAVATLATAVFASIWKGISSITDAHKNDD
jgi:hypothetical protein